MMRGRRGGAGRAGRGTGVFVLGAFLIAVVAPHAFGGEHDAFAPALPSGSDFFLAVRELPGGATPDQVLAAIGRPKQVGRAQPGAGASSELWIYEIQTRSAGKRVAHVFLEQPLGRPMGYRGAEVFIPAGGTIEQAEMQAALATWRSKHTARSLITVGQMLPLGTTPAKVKEVLGRPIDNEIASSGTGTRRSASTYWQESDAKISLAFEPQADKAGEITHGYVGLTVHVRAAGVRLVPNSPN